MSNKQKLTSPFPPIDPRFIWIGLGILTLLFNYFLSLNPYFTEVVYSRGLYLLIRNLFDFTLGLLPFPVLYLAISILIGMLLLRWVKSRKSKQKKALKNRVASTLLTLSAWIGGAIFFFYALWGFNYQRVPLAEKLKLPVQSLDTTLIRMEFEWATKEMVRAREAIPVFSDTSITVVQLPAQMEELVRTELENLLDSMGYPTPGHARCRSIHPEGFLLQSGASGIYIPFVGEGHIDAALPPATRPFTMAHELSHGYGFGEESVCNFLGFLACIQSDNAILAYSGWFDYWREIASLYRSQNPGAYQAFRDQLPPTIVADLQALRNLYEKYPGFFPEISRSIYEWYLKKQGIEEGLRNYSQVVELVYAWRNR